MVIARGHLSDSNDFKKYNLNANITLSADNRKERLHMIPKKKLPVDNSCCVSIEISLNTHFSTPTTISEVQGFTSR